MSTIKFPDVTAHFEDFMLHHSAEAFFFGNLTAEKADALANVAISVRHAYLEARAADEAVAPEANPHLEEWFVHNPVERIVALEVALAKNAILKKKSQSRAPTTGSVGGNAHLSPAMGRRRINGSVPPARSSLMSRPSLTSINTYTSMIGVSSQKQQQQQQADQLRIEEEETASCSDSRETDEPEQTTEFKVPPSGRQQNLFIVHNEIQSSSCVLFYWQYLQNTPGNSALLEAFFHLVREKLISHMKNTVRSVHYYC